MSNHQDPQDDPGWGATAGISATAAKNKHGGLKIFVSVTVVLSLGCGFYVGRTTAPKTTVQQVAAQNTPGAVTGSPTAPAMALGDGSSGSATAADSGAGDGTGPALIDATGSGTVTLQSLTPVTGNFDESDISPVLNGKPQLLAITTSMGQRPGYDCYGSETSGETEYNLSRDYTLFTALLGVDDNSGQDNIAPTVEIDGDGLKLAVYTPTLGHTDQLSVNVTGVLRLDIKWTATNATCPPNFLVFGNAELTTIPGYTPPAPTPTD